MTPIHDASQPPAADPSAPLAVHGLTVAYERKPVLWNVDLTVEEAAMVAVVGPNGAGKSTLVKAVLGLVTPLAGQVRVFGQPVSRQRAAIAYMPQRESVDWTFPASALDVVQMGLYGRVGLGRRLTGAHRRQARDCLERVGLGEFAARQIGELSGGQQQRVFLARALAQDAEIYFMDEPLAGVDAATEGAVLQTMRDLRQSGKTVIAVHHDLASVRRYFDRVVVLNVRVMAEGPVERAFTAEALQQAYGGRLAETELAGAVGG